MTVDDVIQLFQDGSQFYLGESTGWVVCIFGIDRTTGVTFLMEDGVSKLKVKKRTSWRELAKLTYTLINQETI